MFVTVEPKKRFDQRVAIETENDKGATERRCNGLQVRATKEKE